LSKDGRGHLLQRRHGEGDYTYLFVLRRHPDRTARTPLLAGEAGP
jgi:hypothetical protein